MRIELDRGDLVVVIVDTDGRRHVLPWHDRFPESRLKGEDEREEVPPRSEPPAQPGPVEPAPGIRTRGPGRPKRPPPTMFRVMMVDHRESSVLPRELWQLASVQFMQGAFDARFGLRKQPTKGLLPNLALWSDVMSVPATGGSEPSSLARGPWLRRAGSPRRRLNLVFTPGDIGEGLELSEVFERVRSVDPSWTELRVLFAPGTESEDDTAG